MTQDGIPFATIGLLIMVGYFLVAGLSNLAKERTKEHIERLGAQGVPLPVAAFWIGLGFQFSGCGLILADWHADIGVMFLIGFTVSASAIFHRFWSVSDPMRRNMMRINLLSNTGTVGGLFLLLQYVS
jgi:uncharacterized membrane protein YphA (DoxX/SURF4 family)